MLQKVRDKKRRQNNPTQLCAKHETEHKQGNDAKSTTESTTPLGDAKSTEGCGADAEISQHTYLENAAKDTHSEGQRLMR